MHVHLALQSRTCMRAATAAAHTLPFLLRTKNALRPCPYPQVRVFSRNCEDKSGQFPDVAQQVLAAAEGEPGCGAYGDLHDLLVDWSTLAVA